MSNELRERVDQLNTMIQDSKIMEAMNTFYADDVVMGENDNPPCEGLEANLAREQDFVDNTEWFGKTCLWVMASPWFAGGWISIILTMERVWRSIKWPYRNGERVRSMMSVTTTRPLRLKTEYDSCKLNH